jgi:hypothetical protein
MGIQRLRLVSPPAQRLACSADIIELSRSRNPPRGPERQRGLWSFLTWPFILAPIAAAEAFVPQHGHTNLTDEQNDSSARQSHANTPVPQDALATGAPSVVNEQPPADANDTSRLADVLRGTSHDGSPSEPNHAAAPGGFAETPNSSAGGGGGGGGGGGPDASGETQSLSNDTTTSQSTADTSLPGTNGQSLPLDEISKVIQPDTLVSSALDHVEPSIGIVTGAVGPGLSTLVSATSDEISKVIPLDTLVSSALDHVEPSVGSVTGALGSEPSTVDSGTPIGLPVAGEDTPINLKDVLGFDLHVVPGSGAVATEAALAPPGISLSHSIGDLGFVASMPSADSITAPPPGICHEVDDLFAVGQSASDLDNLGNATSPNQMGLVKAGTQADLGIEGLPGGLAAGTTSPAAPVVHTVGEATDVTPGHSLELSTPSLSEGDALFQGTRYTDYHMALQTGISPVGSTISESASVPAITAPPVEQPSLAHADSSAVTQPPEQAAPEHQDLTTPTHAIH